MRKIATLITFVLAATLIVSAATPSTKTLDNLQAAFNGESNAHARYLQFAQKAEAEGYGPVASLFRAAARAEEIHAQNHAAVIQKLGGIPQAKIETAAVKTTRENLEAAIKGETYERDNMYPEFLKEARSVANTDALQTFNFAKNAEAQHARLYAETLANLASLKGKVQTYYVCTVCGATTTKVDFNKCPSCFNSKEKYVQVS